MYTCEFLHIHIHYVVRACVHVCVTKLEESPGAACVQKRSDVTQNRSRSNVFVDGTAVKHLKMLVSVGHHIVLYVSCVSTHECVTLTYVLVCCV